jgi:hypothetical protein
VTADSDEVVDAELVDDGHLPAILDPGPAARPAGRRPAHDPLPRPGPAHRSRPADVHRTRPVRLPGHRPAPQEPVQAEEHQQELRQPSAASSRVVRGAGPRGPAVHHRHLRRVRRHTSSTPAAPRTPSAPPCPPSAPGCPRTRSPAPSEARGMLNEYKKEWAKRDRVKKAPAITDDMLRAMVATCDLNHPIGIRDRCRPPPRPRRPQPAQELADLTIADVTVDDDFVTLVPLLQDRPGSQGRAHRHPRRRRPDSWTQSTPRRLADRAAPARRPRRRASSAPSPPRHPAEPGHGHRPRRLRHRRRHQRLGPRPRAQAGLKAGRRSPRTGCAAAAPRPSPTRAGTRPSRAAGSRAARW